MNRTIVLLTLVALLLVPDSPRATAQFIPSSEEEQVERPAGSGLSDTKKQQLQEYFQSQKESKPQVSDTEFDAVIKQVKDNKAQWDDVRTPKPAPRPMAFQNLDIRIVSVLAIIRFLLDELTLAYTGSQPWPMAGQDAGPTTRPAAAPMSTVISSQTWNIQPHPALVGIKNKMEAYIEKWALEHGK